MQHLETHTLLDSISPKTAIGKGLLQGDVGGTTKRFNQLLDAVQTAASKGDDTADIGGTDGTAKTGSVQLLTEASQTANMLPQDARAPLSNDAQIIPSALNALVVTADHAASSQTRIDISEVIKVRTDGGDVTGNDSALEMANAIAASTLKPVPDQYFASLQPADSITAKTSGLLPLTSPQTAVMSTQAAVTPTQPAVVTSPTLEQSPAQRVTTTKDSLSNPRQMTQIEDRGMTPRISSSASQQEAPAPKPQPHQVWNSSSATADRLTVANLTPQAQSTTPQIAAVRAITPGVVPPPAGQRPQTAIPIISAGATQTSAAVDAVDQPTHSIRPARTIEAQQIVLPGALKATVDTENEAQPAAKSVWQAIKDTQPGFLTKSNAQVLASAPDAAAVNELPETLSRTPAEALQPVSTASKDLTSVSPAQSAAAKAPVSKPFSEALMMQVKAAEVVDGRTSVHLHPRGLGNIEVEIIAGEKDLASKVIVRVENPMILQHLRDDRQLLAQTIGVSDGTVFEFHERGAEQQGNQSNGGQTAFADTSLEGLETSASALHADILTDDRIDILT